MVLHFHELMMTETFYLWQFFEVWVEVVSPERICVYLCQMAQLVKDLPTNAEDAREVGSVPGSGRSLGILNGNPLHYSCLENSMDREQATVHRVTKNQTQLSD